jgi:hypothetical protein
LKNERAFSENLQFAIFNEIQRPFSKRRIDTDADVRRLTQKKIKSQRYDGRPKSMEEERFATPPIYRCAATPRRKTLYENGVFQSWYQFSVLKKDATALVRPGG